MGKILGVILLLIICLAVGFLINLVIDGLVILLKKLGKKIRFAMGIPFKEEQKNDLQVSDEAPSEEEKTKNNPNDILQKILAKRKNAASDVEHPVCDDTIVEVTDYEIKE